MQVQCTCQRCGVSFPVKPYRAAVARYCSYECSNGPRIGHTCEVCGGAFTTRRSAADAARFCSIACKAVSQTIPPTDRFWPHVNKSGPVPDSHPEYGPCWLWTAGLGSGYGTFGPGGRSNMGAHVWAFEQAFGPIPAGMCVLHTCDVRPCVRNDEPGIYVVDGIAHPRYGHLFLGTKTDNNRDMWAKGRGPTGDRAGSRTKPESLRRGDDHPHRLHPERLPHGDDHWMRQHPGILAGERNGVSKLTDVQVIEIRRRWAEGNVTQTALAAELGVTQGLIGHIVRGKAWRHLL